MTRVIYVFMLLTLVKMLTGCAPPVDELGRTLGCIAKGTDCGARGRDGSDGSTGLRGQDGIAGQTGAVGPTGANGSSCSVSAVAPGGAAPNGGARISCTDGTDALIFNGAPGQSAPPMIGISQVVKPCPAIAGSYPEVFLLLSDRTILVYFVVNGNAATARLSVLTPGNYVTSDGRNCAVTVTTSSVTWAGGGVNY